MSINNKVRLIGFLGKDAKVLNNKNGQYTVLQLATTDSYPTLVADQTIWKNKNTIWHSVFVFRPQLSITAKELGKGDMVDVSGSISYQKFTDESGHLRQEAIIVANSITKINRPKPDNTYVKELINAIAVDFRSLN